MERRLDYHSANVNSIRTSICALSLSLLLLPSPFRSLSLARSLARSRRAQIDPISLVSLLFHPSDNPRGKAETVNQKLENKAPPCTRQNTALYLRL